MTTRIKNQKTYLENMKASMADKAFFIREIDLNDVDIIVDFGSGSGDLGLALRDVLRKNNIQYLGYDNNPELARETKGERIVSDWAEVEKATKGKSALLVLSSVVHEIYHYLSEKEIRETFDMIKEINFKYIVVRDMYKDYEINNNETSNWLIDNYDKVKQQLNQEQIEYYDKQEKTKKTKMDIFFKFNYKENATRELREEYWYNIDNLLKELTDYDINLETYALDYTKNLVKEKFGYELKGDTHYKIIAKRK